MIRKMMLIAGCALFVAIVGSADAQAKGPAAKAQLKDAQGQMVGSAILLEGHDEVAIILDVSNLSPGTHAFHIHSVGRCEPPNFKSAGPHFNPQGKKHGMKNPEGAHAGDLSNIVVGPEGKAQVHLVAQGVTLGPGKNSLFQAEGTSLVVHANPDDEMTDPTGNAGDRIACGVITPE